jgi:hypothetical protein
MAYFDGLSPLNWSGEDSRRFWQDLEAISRLADDDLVDVLGDLSARSDLPTWLLLVVFQAVWSNVLATRPSELRRLRLPFELLEQRGTEEGSDDTVDICRRLCPFLVEIIDEDLNWTDLRLPGDV